MFSKKKFEGKDHFGLVITSRDGIAKVYGLNLVTSGEMITDCFGNLGLVLNLEYNLTGIVMFTENCLVAGDVIIRLFSTLSTLVNPFVLGNVFNPLGHFLNLPCLLNFKLPLTHIIEELGAILRRVELKAPGIIVRQPVYETVYTGILGVDGLLPLGQGQRELIIGDRQTGKTAVAIDIILNQSNIDSSTFKYALKLTS